MSYTVRFRTHSYANQTGLASSTNAVVLLPSEADVLGGIHHFTKASSVFTPKDSAGNQSGTPRTYAVGTLASVVARSSVIIESAVSGQWAVGDVFSDGTQVLASDQGAVASLASSTRAAAVQDEAQSGPPIKLPLTLSATASDGTVWFSDGNNNVVVKAGSLTTLGTFASGSRVIVEVTTGQWQLMTL